MGELTPAMTAAITGFVAGFLQCIPVGPVSLTILNEGARRGFRWVMAIAAGAILAELIYCVIAFTSFAGMFSHGVVRAAMELISFVFILYLGIKFLQAKELPHNPRIEERIEERFHPHSAFWIGFVRVIGNPGILLFWGVLAANFISRGWVTPDMEGKVGCVGGIMAGVTTWFFTLGYTTSLGHRRLSAKTLLKMEHFSGIGLILLAVAHGVRIIWQMAHHRM